MLSVVIPMAGDGSRFKNAGYKIPKPFIDINGKMMIEWVLESFSGLNAEFILILQEKFLSEQKEQLAKLSGVKFVSVPKLTMGAAITALAAHKSLSRSNDIIFADSDNIFKQNDIKNFVSNVQSRNLDGALLTINSDNPCFSYAKVDDCGTLIETREKTVISNHAICGVYYFKNIELFKNAVIDLVIESDLQKGEFYMSGVFNHLKKETDKIGIFEIENFDCTGTPEQMDEFIRRINA